MTAPNGTRVGERQRRSSLSPRWTWIVAASTLVAAFAVIADLPPAVRAPLVTWVVLVCPAVGFGYRSRAADPLARGVIGGLGAVGAATVVAELLLLAHVWSPIALLLVMGASATLLVTDRFPRRTQR